MITTSHQAEFSCAFIRAVAASAGCSIASPVPDRNSIDLTISSEAYRCPRLDVQVKSTKNFALNGPQIPYPLKVSNYNDLRADVIVPRLLVLVTLPETHTEWLMLEEHHLLLKHCAYWHSLKGLPASSNSDSVTIHINRDHIFNVGNLKEIMKKISHGHDL